MKKRIHSYLLIAMLLASPAHAFSISSGVTTGCHEGITISAFQLFALDLPVDYIQVPDSEEWRELAVYLVDLAGLGEFAISDAHRFMLLSLMIGVRSPDTDGHSVFDLNSLRELHSDPSDEGQYAHALRGLGDDGWEGNQAVVDGTRQIIIDRMEEANTTIRQAPGKQLTTGTIYLDFYGRVSVPVYAPIFLVGQAAHALQDSFAHTLRTEDYRQILHAMNYVDAIGGSHDEDRDGMAHSDSMDDCTTGGRERVEAAIEATVDLLIAARERFSDKDPNAVVHVLDKWLTLQPAEECTLANAYCNANMLAHARVKQTAPYLEGIFGCESLTMTARPQERDAGVALTLLLAFAMMLRSGYTRTKAPALGQSTVRRSSH